MINKKLLLSVLSIGTLVLGAVAPVTAFAAESRIEQSTATAAFKENTVDPVDPVDPTNPTDPTDPEIPGTGETGPLTIDYVSSFDFGTHNIPTADATYTAADAKKGDGTAIPNYVQVSDRRAGTPKGWSLTVKEEKQFVDTTGSELSGAALSLGTSQKQAASVGYPTSNDTVTSTTTDTALVPGATTSVMKADVGGGAGTWVDVFGEAGASSVKLMVPAAAHPNADSYSTKLTWTLADTPSGD
ncbi:extracellular protein [Pediococcus damnosus]|uniref:Extracellular protein n=1 Tax=Pediococcus damnosus TaxID=51663 RepID=A0A0R2H4A8_9LACO|nr:WxL domain-containing protein [Pediococcus damnosus]AMV60205.1 extracellular protein [Pediococcus damnosus]AMV62727.1 extracellular protein [Pediococcus damnosus]AMV67388.1 extracellular protein [Pediococcus damnosus]AMV69685.1 extracellular protein [Pediococcus damnosus]KRN47416.1 cell surface protein [Pediococcus damnosus]